MSKLTTHALSAAIHPRSELEPNRYFANSQNREQACV